MKTLVQKQGDTWIISMNGCIELSTTDPLRENLTQLFTPVQTDEAPKKIIFNLENLEFVGSSGILQFIRTLKDLNTSLPTPPRYCHMKSEFRKLIQAFNHEKAFEIYDNLERAHLSFEN